MPRILPVSGAAGRMAVACADSGPPREQAQAIATELELPFLGIAEPKRIRDFGVLLYATDQGLALVLTGKGAPGPVSAEFVSGKAGYRREHGGGTGQLVARAIGLQKTRYPLQILDATAGLGQDAFVMASLGCQVRLVERSVPVHAVLRDGLARALLNVEVAPVIARMQLARGDSTETLRELSDGVDVIYLDPMFPHSNKAALAKKEMQVFREVVGDDTDAPALLSSALAAAPCRVVVKRPRKAPAIEGPEPTLRIEGKSSRYDIYALRALPGTSAAQK